MAKSMFVNTLVRVMRLRSSDQVLHYLGEILERKSSRRVFHSTISCKKSSISNPHHVGDIFLKQSIDVLKEVLSTNVWII